MASYMFMSINSKTSASLPVGSSLQKFKIRSANQTYFKQQLSSIYAIPKERFDKYWSRKITAKLNNPQKWTNSVWGNNLLENFMQGNNVGMRWQTFQSLDFSQIIHLLPAEHKSVKQPHRLWSIKQTKTSAYLVDVIKVSFHTLNGYIFVCLGGLGLQDLRERPLSLLTDQSILYIQTHQWYHQGLLTIKVLSTIIKLSQQLIERLGLCYLDQFGIAY